MSRAPGSREIPAWLLALLVVLTIAAVALFAPGAQAAPINCQGDQEYYFAVAEGSPGGASQWWTDCGYRYEVPGLAATPLAPALPPIAPAPTAPVPEPAAWALLAAGLAVVGAVARRRRSIPTTTRPTTHEEPHP